MIIHAPATPRRTALSPGGSVPSAGLRGFNCYSPLLAHRLVAAPPPAVAHEPTVGRRVEAT
tara:strand:- start:508 stop:690 length:183 start_codon:yes stop_codon:yes gene_type:complete